MIRQPDQNLWRRWAVALAALVFLIAALPAQAGEKATLIADTVQITSGSTLVASGSVEVFYMGARLTAHRVVYDRALNRLIVEGPISLDDGKSITIIASTAEISDDFANGIITSARVIIDQQLQVTAGTLQRVDGRYNAMYKVAASSCQVCQGRAPLWEIRASRVVHDTVEKQMYFNDAQFRVAGIPLAYFPRLRLADPTLKRATGFLVPKIEVTSTLGFGIKMPYFIVLGPSRDLTITPFVSNSGSRSIDLRYRQAFRTGTVTINGAISQDEELTGKLRGYVLASGSFQLRRGYKLDLRAETVSDAGYFRGYGLAEQDHFVTSLQISRAARDAYVHARILGFTSLRSGVVNATQPSQIADFERVQRISLGPWGDASFAISANARQRASTSIIAADGRDVAGFGVRAEWKKGVILPYGVLANAALMLRADAYTVQQDALFEGQYQRGTGAFAAELRWPLVKYAASGAAHTLEPIVQMVLAPDQAQCLFNEDGALVEFDEGNLFAINRFPGSDQIETGSRANLGLRYTFAGPRGARAQLALGRAVSSLDGSQFSAASGLGQGRSDWLIASQVDLNNRFGFTLRGLLTEAGHLRKLDFRGAVSGAQSGVSLGYLFVPADLDEDRSAPISEISLFAKQKLSERWNTSLTSRYDAQDNKFSRSGIAMVYRNECLQLDLSLSRNFTSSSTVKANTTFGLSVAFLGFGGQAAGVAEQCRG